MKYTAILIASSVSALPTLLEAATNISNINLGMMTAMQTDMTATTTDCYAAATATGDAIVAAGTLENYASGVFNTGDFINLGQVVAIQLMD